MLQSWKFLDASCIPCGFSTTHIDAGLERQSDKAKFFFFKVKRKSFKTNEVLLYSSARYRAVLVWYLPNYRDSTLHIILWWSIHGRAPRRRRVPLTDKCCYHIIFGYFIVVRVEFDVQLIADGKFVFQMLHGSDAAQAAVHHDGQTGAQSFAFFETVEKKNGTTREQPCRCRYMRSWVLSIRGKTL